ncbi:unnamed protein product [Meloidogyne enterolobii]|uniref:Uncharacterized protein n=1 Tax=Meloidogyne enterolobii TaxID=390850 RepID=A0ACB1AWK7_MELEN
MEEIIEIEINDYIDPNERRIIEKNQVKSEETLSEIFEDSNYENKELKGRSEHGSDEIKQRKSKKQLKREKRLKKEINKGKYTLGSF